MTSATDDTRVTSGAGKVGDVFATRRELATELHTLEMRIETNEFISNQRVAELEVERARLAKFERRLKDVLTVAFYVVVLAMVMVLGAVAGRATAPAPTPATPAMTFTPAEQPGLGFYESSPHQFKITTPSTPSTDL